jgi:REP element-mobilizing transposase RayT
MNGRRRAISSGTERGLSARAGGGRDSVPSAERFGARRPAHVDLPRQPVFVSTRTIKGLAPFQGMAASIAVDELLRQREQFDFLLLAYALMPDHAHLVVVPAEGFTIAQTMRAIKGAIARVVNEHLGRAGALWQSGFLDKNPRDLRALNEFIRYVHDNPVAARLVRDSTDYPYSSASGECDEDYRRFLDMEQT